MSVIGVTLDSSFGDQGHRGRAVKGVEITGVTAYIGRGRGLRNLQL